MNVAYIFYALGAIILFVILISWILGGGPSF
jgi:hypothetical protein